MFKNIKAVVFDLDGTIYYGSKIIEGANDTIRHCKELGKKVFFVTNNSTKTRKQVYEKLVDMGVHCSLEEVYTSGYVATLYAQKENLKNIYIFGSDNLISEFHAVGIDVVNEEEADNLLIGYDPNFDYESLTKALHVALKANKILACNKERHFPGENARRLPGCGAMVAPIELCANRKADYVIGKPNTLMLEILCEMCDLTVDELLMVGDTYESDIAMANKMGCKSVLITNQSGYEDTVCVDKIDQLIQLI